MGTAEITPPSMYIVDMEKRTYTEVPTDANIIGDIAIDRYSNGMSIRRDSDNGAVEIKEGSVHPIPQTHRVLIYLDQMREQKKTELRQQAESLGYRSASLSEIGFQPRVNPIQAARTPLPTSPQAS